MQILQNLADLSGPVHYFAGVDRAFLQILLQIGSGNPFEDQQQYVRGADEVMHCRQSRMVEFAQYCSLPKEVAGQLTGLIAT